MKWTEQEPGCGDHTLAGSVSLMLFSTNEEEVERSNENAEHLSCSPSCSGEVDRAESHSPLGESRPPWASPETACAPQASGGLQAAQLMGPSAVSGRRSRSANHEEHCSRLTGAAAMDTVLASAPPGGAPRVTGGARLRAETPRIDH